jgi:hypothetical protein
MPVTKVPVVHKFGIISLSQAEQLLRRQKLREETEKFPTSNKSTSCPIITLDFIAKYNSSDKERDALDGIIKRVLEHAKFKSTSPTIATTKDEPDVSEGWLELIMLCQCYGPYQESISVLILLDHLRLILECLTTLNTSLLCSPLSRLHIPVLFYMSGLCYHWLKCDTSPSSTMRTGELLLLNVILWPVHHSSIIH